MIVLVTALLSGGVAMLFAARAALRYSRVIVAMRALSDEELMRLPRIIREALSSRWALSWQSTIFHEIAIGDIEWASRLTCGSSIIKLRSDLRWMFVGFVGVFVALLIQLALSRG